MDHRLIARILLTTLAVSQGTATLTIDLNRTHATNPIWPGHARFHLVWQNASCALLAALAIWLVWSRGSGGDLLFNLSAILTAIPMFGFLAALMSRSLYRGTLSDPNGIPPARIRIFGRSRSLDLNLMAVAAGVLVLAVVVALHVS